MNICSIFKVPPLIDLSNKYFKFILGLDPRHWCVKQAQSLLCTNFIELYF